MVDVLLKDGGVIIKDFLSPELMKEFEEQIAPLVEAEPVTVNDQLSEGGEAFVPPCTKRVFGLLGKTPSPISKVVMDPVWNALMSAGLSDSVSMYSGDEMITQKTGYLLSAAVAIQAMSGSSAQRLHRDQLCRDYYRQEENMLAIVPLDVARSLPEPVLRRCGWAKGAGGSGFVNHRHPFEYLGSMDKASVGFAV
ncbi:hypothetical protein MNV49_004775 [Pseudohyphozyma bogoriensis]|nr:hypothetical protein MNV49_004775 [Pseudohyphozyma bogoriensis]